MESLPKTMPATCAMTVCFTGPSTGSTPKFDARNVMPTNSTPRTPAMIIKVVAAFFDSGGLKAGTPVAIASVPVSATAPEAKARRRTMTPTAWVVWEAAAMASGEGGRVSCRTTMRNTPTPIIRNALPRNR